jgi:ribosomal protein S18 acetylase RimI-like enzyme
MLARSIATRPDPLVRPATPADAPDLARFVDLASEGMVRRFWAEMAESGADILAVGVRRAERDEGAFSWRNAWVAEVGGAVAGGMVGYPIADAPEPVEEAPPIARPLVALENEAPGTWYVNVLATDAPSRGRGVATALLRHAASVAEGRELSLIVADANATARRLYAAFGFVERARRPVVNEGWESASREWVLMLRPTG